MDEELRGIGEEALVARLIERLPKSHAMVGPGDDCAVVEKAGRRVLLKTDAVVEGVHFMANTDPQRVGWKAVARVASDFAAMGAWPEEYLITLALPSCRSVAWVDSLYAGMARCLGETGGEIVGGETVSMPEGAPAVVSVAGIGGAEVVVTRAGGRVGDVLWVTGRLGGSLASGRHLDFFPRLKEGQWLATYAKAMMDLSDGLVRDLPRLARASGCAYRLEREQLPRHVGCSVEQALSDGEDFELLLAAPQGAWSEEFRKVFPETELTAIGSLVDVGDGEMDSVTGWQHFKS